MCCFVLLLLSVCRPLQGQNTSSSARQPKVAVVLSGGGAKGFAHIGVLKVLEEEGIPVDIIVGTSIGSLIGGVYSLGYTASEVEKIVKSQDWENVLSDNVSRLFLGKNDQIIAQRYLFSLPMNSKNELSLPQGMIKGQNVLNIFCGLSGNVPANADFSKFPISFACVAANLENGNEEVLTHGFLPTAMYASMAIPGVFHPCERDSLILVDGGVVNNFPVDVAKQMGADVIIGVDIRGDYYDRTKLKSLGEIFANLINFYSKEKDTENKRLCNLIIRPDVSGYTAASFSHEAADTLIERGEKAAEAMREQIRELKSEYHLVQHDKSRDLVMPEKWKITDVRFHGVKEINKDFLKKTLDLQFPGSYSYDEIKNSVDRLYGTGGFDKVYFSLNDNAKGKTLNLHISTTEVRSQNIGFKVNTTDAAALMLNATWKDYSRTIGFFSVSAELSANPGLSIVAETNKRDFPDLGFELKGKYQNYNIYNHGHKIFEADLFYSSAALSLGQSFLNWWKTGVGIQEEFFDGDVFLKNSNTTSILANKDKFWLTNAYAYFSFDNMDHFYFPERGSRLYVEFTGSTDFQGSGEFSPSLLLKMNHVLPTGKKTAILLDLYGRAFFSSDYPQIKTTLVGGDSYSHYFNYHFPFMGLPPVVLADRFAYVGMAGIRLHISDSQYLSFIFNTLQQGSRIDELNHSHAVYGGGVKYSLKTIVGPLDIGLGYSGAYKKPTVSANLGYWF